MNKRGFILITRRGYRACLHKGGGPQVGEVTCGGLPHLTCKRDQIKMRDYMDRRVTPPKRVTLPTWGPSPQCKQAPVYITAACVLFQIKLRNLYEQAPCQPPPPPSLPRHPSPLGSPHI